MPELSDEAEDDGGEDITAGEIMVRLTFSDRDTPGLTIEGGVRPLTLN